MKITPTENQITLEDGFNGLEEKRTGLRNAGKNFGGNNYISLFHGRRSERHGSRNARDLTEQEVKDLNRALRK